MSEPRMVWNWEHFGPTSFADVPHMHWCTQCYEDHPCSLECTDHPEHGPSHGYPVLCETCSEAPDGLTFTCEVCLQLTDAEDGAADEYPRACSDCWAAFHEEVPRG